jgi:hypothetical protein
MAELTKKRNTTALDGDAVKGDINPPDKPVILSTLGIKPRASGLKRPMEQVQLKQRQPR